MSALKHSVYPMLADVAEVLERTLPNKYFEDCEEDGNVRGTVEAGCLALCQL